MQSLVLATSLLLSSQSPISISDIEQDVSLFVQQETNKVSNFVNYTAEIGAKDNLLYQSRLVIRQAKADRANNVSKQVAAD